MPNPDGSVNRPSGSGTPQGSGNPRLSPGNTQRNDHTKSSVILPGPANSLVEGDAVNPLNANGFVGVMPMYQNFANETESPNPTEPEV